VPTTEDDGFEPTSWWRVVAPDGSLWCETSNVNEARRVLRIDDRLERLYVKTEEEWRGQT